ncbi:uncharacterized protein TRAVEDRAFT_42677 [Trametes versicolor FP-101664 SS1]|uniref:uncharacterized protein n=1 Tax=Trametes versicolor (strain FP-101664) TaxID=717944 RepID=UPI0004621BD5|nr:uncharacterized protein TRAVEDRAFT_42677 [Trametes versicolor FP-101664 SS1]EIW65296.1 hypothetical protein TRAVEDRAFT_42677 [Trametes versicolor FP-101664 SS1]
MGSLSETPGVSSGMQRRPLPLKVCKQVIHAVRSISPGYDTLREETQAVLACALVCRDWKAVSQSVLWEAVAVRTDEQIERLIHAFGRKTSSEQGDPLKVYTLCTSQSNSGIRFSAASGENDATSTERPRDIQANPATTQLRDLLVKLGSTGTDLRTLDLNAVIWTEWPIRLDQFWQWPFAQSLEELRLSGCPAVKKLELELDNIVLTATSSPKPDTLSSNIGDSKDIEAFSAHPDLQMSLLAALYEATPHLRWVLVARTIVGDDD